MRLVIDIDENDYKHLLADFPEMFWSASVKKAIMNGTLLPVGHGRLIDADNALLNIKPICFDDSQYAVTGQTAKLLCCKAINDAPTIIPAEDAIEREKEDS